MRRTTEERLHELHVAGELSGLPGEGSPLPPDPDDDAGDAWAARHVMRTAGASPPWADLRREIAEERARLVTRLRAHHAWLAGRDARLRRLPGERILGEREATRAVDERVRGELEGAIGELKALVARHNLMVVPALQLPPPSREGLEELARS